MVKDGVLLELARRHRAVTALFLVVLLLVVLIAVTPKLIGWQLQKWLIANGADQATITNIDFNPFTGQARLEGMSIHAGGEDTLELDTLQAAIEWGPLFEQRVMLSAVRIDGLYLLVDVSDPAQPVIAGIRPPATDSTTGDAADAAPWSVRLPLVELLDHEFNIKRSAGKTSLKLASLTLQGFDTATPEEAFSLSLDGQLDDAPLQLDGNFKPLSATPSFDATVRLQGLQLGPFLAEIDPALQDNQLTLQLDNQYRIDSTQQGLWKISMQGKTGVDDVRWQQADQHISTAAINWQGELLAEATASGGWEISQQGSTRVDALGWQQAQRQINAGTLEWEGNLQTELTAGQSMRITSDGVFTVAGLLLELGSELPSVNNSKLRWQGELNLVTNQASADGGEVAATTQVDLQGELENQGLRIDMPLQDALLEQALLGWQGKLALQTGENQLQLTSESDLQLEGVDLARPSDGQSLLAFSSLQVNEIKLQSLEQVSLAKLKLEGLSIGERDQSEAGQQGVLKQQQMVLEDLSYEPAMLHIKRLVPGQMHAYLSRDKSGQWNFEKLMPAQQPDEQVAIENTGTPMTLKIDEVVLSDTAEIVYVDQLLADQPFRQELQIETLQIQSIDSSDMSPSPLRLKAKKGRASISLEGNVTLFAPQPVFDLQGQVDSLSMLPYSHFLEKLLGYEVDSGILSAQSNLKSKDGKLESSTDLTLQQLNIKPLTTEELEKLGVKQNTSIETGLSMLRDKNDTIRIKLPVNGDLENLQVDPADVINQALGSALKTGAKTYFAAALFPFGTLLVIADAATDAAMQVKLDPVDFTPGKHQISSKNREYLGKVAGVLQDKPEITVKVCGFAIVADRDVFVEQMKQEYLAGLSEQQRKDSKLVDAFSADPTALQTRLKQLAQQRADVVMQHLQETHAVKAARLVDCQPRVQLEQGDALPRADLLL